MTCGAMPNAISSRASADGPTLFDWLDGRTTDPCGPGHAPASRSAKPANGMVSPTTDTFGRSGTPSSASASLQRSLENRLPLRLGNSGSTLFRQTWKRKATPSGRPYLAHTASARRTSDSDCGSWPTPDGKSPEAHLATKRRMGERDGSGASRTAITDLQVLAKTVTVWATPTATDGCRGVRPPRPHDTGRPLSQQVGMIVSGSHSLTASGGQLNPAFTRWLMGYPSAWDECAPTATPSSRK